MRYAYGFSRTLYVVVSDRDLQCGSVPVIGCDWNKDGKIDDQDYYMFKLIFGTHQGQAGYLSYVDMNHDGMINTRDMIFVERCMEVLFSQRQKVVLTLTMVMCPVTSFSYVLLRLRLLSAFTRTAPPYTAPQKSYPGC